MARPTAMDEYFVHQIPELLPGVAVHHHHWRESYFYELHDPSGDGDAVFFTMAHYPAQERMDSLQMGRVGGRQLLGVKGRPYDGDPHTTAVPGARVDVVKPMQEVRLWAEPSDGTIGLDLTWQARTQPYGLRRGTMRAGHELIWDQSHIFQSGTYTGTYTVDGTGYEVDGWIGQRDHSWGIRDHGRCPLWMWWQIQLDDGFLGVWHWELPNGAIVYRDGCWAGAGMSEPVPVVDFRYDASWTGADRQPASYGEHGDDIAGLMASATFTLADRRVIEVDAQGTMARTYEPFHRGGLSLMRVSTGDGRRGTAIYEITGARHHHFFPGTVVEGTLPA
ncbi:MAG TPA: hypothetical protein VFQ68_42740 [Streptosporangiaceae bacterium]|nr:hypothetical protein [Streptosporangiaceae bacterium]